LRQSAAINIGSILPAKAEWGNRFSRKFTNWSFIFAMHHDILLPVVNFLKEGSVVFHGKKAV
jgi:hypothetical protein